MAIADNVHFGIKSTFNGLYTPWCICGWDEPDVETVETAGHLLDLHVGDKHPDDEGLA